MLSRPEVADSSTVGADLASHALDRLDGLLEGLDEASASLAAPPGEAWDRAAILAMVQYADDPQYGATGPGGLRALPVALDEAGIEVLRQEAAELDGRDDPILAFEQFAGIEDRFEHVEAKLQSLLLYIDGKIQAELDRIRGR
jgi:hypothetical protein